MFSSDITYIGIDPTAGERPFVYAAIDNDLNLLALGNGSIDDVLAFCAGQRRAWVAVCSPRRPNIGIMQKDEIRENLSPAPTPGRWMNFRVADYYLRQHNIHIPHTPSNIDDCPNWMQMGFSLFNRLKGLGYHAYPDDHAERLNLEIYPHAGFTALLGVIPFPKYNLEGRIQRQLVLYEHKLQVPDPMRIFEEITRFRLLHGVLPLEDLLSAGELDSMLAAYTAWLAAHDPDSISILGHPDEGQIVLPVPKLKESYSQG